MQKQNKLKILKKYAKFSHHDGVFHNKYTQSLCSTNRYVLVCLFSLYDKALGELGKALDINTFQTIESYEYNINRITQIINQDFSQSIEIYIEGKTWKNVSTVYLSRDGLSNTVPSECIGRINGTLLEHLKGTYKIWFNEIFFLKLC